MNSLQLPAALVLAAGCLAPVTWAQTLRPYHVIDLGSPIGQNPMAGVGAEALSPDGDLVAGSSVWEPYVWARGTGMRQLQKLPGYRTAGANAVTNAGIAVGRCGLDTGSWEPYRAVWWDANGLVNPLQQPGWRHSIAIDVNEAQLVLIHAGISTGTNTWVNKAFVGPLGGPYLQMVPGSAASSATDLNQRGQVCLTGDGIGPARYTPGIGLQALPIEPARLNDYGQVAGFPPGQNGVVRYTDNLGVHRFPTSLTFREVGGIDSFGQVVATEWVRTGISPPSYTRYGYLLSDVTGVTRLETLVDHPVPVRVGSVAAIADTGVIAASGSIGPDNRAMLLVPRFLHVYGQGCAGSNGVPRAVAVGVPAGGGSVAVLAAGGVPNGTGAFLLAFARGAVPLPGGCTVAVDPANAIIVPASPDAIGQARLTLNVPVGVGGFSLFAQFASIDPAAPNGLFAASNGVRIDVQ